MRLLLDSHIVIWSVEAPARLSERARQILADPANERVLSVVSTWELSIKLGAGRLRTRLPVRALIARATSDLALIPLGVEQEHAFRVADLPRHHGDPFDRLLIAQAQIEGLSIVSTDPFLSRYEVEVIW